MNKDKTNLIQELIKKKRLPKDEIFNGKRLRELRLNIADGISLTQEDLGKILNVSKSSICCYEKGTRKPSLNSLIDLMFIFGVSADYLLGTETKVMTDSNKKESTTFMTKEEVEFIKKLRAEKHIYSFLIDDPDRGIENLKVKF